MRGEKAQGGALSLKHAVLHAGRCMDGVSEKDFNEPIYIRLQPLRMARIDEHIGQRECVRHSLPVWYQSFQLISRDVQTATGAPCSRTRNRAQAVSPGRPRTRAIFLAHP